MRNKTMNEATQQYYRILKDITLNGVGVINTRTNTKVYQCIDVPITYSVWLKDKFPILQNRKYSLYIAAAETAWQLSGEYRTDLINKWAPKLWSKFEDDPGCIYNAQGYRWRKHFGIDQIERALNQIISNPTDRQILVSSWDPKTDYPGAELKNKHCLPFMHFRVDSNNVLHTTIYSRSADMILGFPYDVYNYAFLIYAICESTDTKPGYMNIVLNNYHVYALQNHIDVMDMLLNEEEIIQTELQMLPIFSVDNIIQNPDKYVQWVKDNMKVTHLYAPKLELVV